jgi:hypothetical protein
VDAMAIDLLIKAGLTGVCIAQIWLLWQFMKELREIRRAIYLQGEKFLYLASVIVDHKARAGDETPPARPFTERPQHGT